MLRLNRTIPAGISSSPKYSNTTNVKVKLIFKKLFKEIDNNSNTTNVKVKLKIKNKADKNKWYSNTTNVKVKHFLLYTLPYCFQNSNTTNVKVKRCPRSSPSSWFCRIQIQPMLRLNMPMMIQSMGEMIEFKYNQC